MFFDFLFYCMTMNTLFTAVYGYKQNDARRPILCVFVFVSFELDRFGSNLKIKPGVEKYRISQVLTTCIKRNYYILTFLFTGSLWSTSVGGVAVSTNSSCEAVRRESGLTFLAPLYQTQTPSRHPWTTLLPEGSLRARD